MNELQKLMQEVKTFTEERDWDQFHTPANLAKSISIEAAELLECWQWNDDADPAAVEEELADVLNYCLLLAEKLHLDPIEIIRKSLLSMPGNIPLRRAEGEVRNMISFNVQIRDFPFDENSQAQIESWHGPSRDYGTNWPVVYLIHNDDTREAYIGETLNAGRRAAQHWQVEERKRLKTIHIMTDDTFNKSVILDLESFLIKYISADGKYKLQNGNAGLSSFDYLDC